MTLYPAQERNRSISEGNSKIIGSLFRQIKINFEMWFFKSVSIFMIAAQSLQLIFWKMRAASRIPRAALFFGTSPVLIPVDTHITYTYIYVYFYIYT